MSLNMDNFHIDVLAHGSEALALALKLALLSEHAATHWAAHPHKGLVLFWSKPECLEYVDAREVKTLPTFGSPHDEVYVKKDYYALGRTYRWTEVKDDLGDPSGWVWREVPSRKRPLEVHPFPFEVHRVEDLMTFVIGWLKGANYGEEPDHDGSNTKGFRVYNDVLGRISDCGSYAFVAIQPEWAEHGK